MDSYNRLDQLIRGPVSSVKKAENFENGMEYYVYTSPTTGTEVVISMCSSDCKGISSATKRPCVKFLVKADIFEWCGIANGIITPDGNGRVVKATPAAGGSGAVASSPAAGGGGAFASSTAAVGGGAVASSTAAVAGGASTSSFMNPVPMQYLPQQWLQQQWLQQQQWQWQQQQRLHAPMPMPLHGSAGATMPLSTVSAPAPIATFAGHGGAGSAPMHHVHVPAPPTAAPVRHGGAGSSAMAPPAHAPAPPTATRHEGAITTAPAGPLVEHKPIPTRKPMSFPMSFPLYMLNRGRANGKDKALKYIPETQFSFNKETVTVLFDNTEWIPCNLKTHEGRVQCLLPHLVYDEAGKAYLVVHCYYSITNSCVLEDCWHFHDEKVAASAPSGGAVASATVPLPKQSTFAAASTAGLGDA